MRPRRSTERGPSVCQLWRCRGALDAPRSVKGGVSAARPQTRGGLNGAPGAARPRDSPAVHARMPLLTGALPSWSSEPAHENASSAARSSPPSSGALVSPALRADSAAAASACSSGRSVSCRLRRTKTASKNMQIWNSLRTVADLPNARHRGRLDLCTTILGVINGSRNAPHRRAPARRGANLTPELIAGPEGVTRQRQTPRTVSPRDSAAVA